MEQVMNNQWVAIAVGCNCVIPFVMDIVDDVGKQKIINKYNGTKCIDIDVDEEENNRTQDQAIHDACAKGYLQEQEQEQEDEDIRRIPWYFNELELEYDVYYVGEVEYKYQFSNSVACYVYFVKKENHSIIEIIEDLDIM